MEDFLQLNPKFLFSDARKSYFGEGTIQLQWFRVTKFMESVRDVVRIGCFPGDFLEKGFPSDFDDASHVVAVESMENLVFLIFASELKFYFLAEMIRFGGISLLYNYLDDILAFEDFVGDHRHIYNGNLHLLMFTSSRLKKSTGGTILSAKVFIKSRN